MYLTKQKLHVYYISHSQQLEHMSDSVLVLVLVLVHVHIQSDPARSLSQKKSQTLFMCKSFRASGEHESAAQVILSNRVLQDKHGTHWTHWTHWTDDVTGVWRPRSNSN